MANKFCSVCNACGCGVPIFEVNGIYYCTAHRPFTPSTAFSVDAQILTTQQKLNIANGQ